MLGPWDLLLQTATDALLEQLRSRIRLKEANQAHQHALERDAATAELRERSAQADFARAWQAEEHSAVVRLWEQLSLDEQKMRHETSPFKLPEEDIRSIAEAATQGGKFPALIFAPFVDREGDSGGTHVYRQLWWHAQHRATWMEGMVSLTGHMRPVSDFDIDVNLIQNVLRTIPFVLIHGDVEIDRVRVRIVGSGVFPQPCVDLLAAETSTAGPTVSIYGMLPWPDVPGSHRLAEEMCDTVLACVGALGEVFHLARTGRLPHLHERVPDWLRPGILAMIIAGYGVAIERAAWDPEIVRGLQDLVAAMPNQDRHKLRQRAEDLLNGVMNRIATRGLLED
jgi:hypothetical protein